MEVAAPVARPHRHISSQDGEMVSPHAAVGHGDDNVAVGEVEIGGIAAAEASASPHAAVGGGADRPKLTEELSPNVIGRHWHKHGDVDAALAGSDARVSGRFKTDWVYQGYLEPHAATRLDGPVSGDLVVSSSTQGIFYTRSQLAKIFGLPVTKVRSIGDAARRGVRLQDHGRRAARRRRLAGPQAAGPARAHAARGHVDDEPGVRRPGSSWRSARPPTAG